MGQKFDKLRFSCIDCGTYVSTQEENFTEAFSRTHPIRSSRNYERHLQNLALSENSLISCQPFQNKSPILTNKISNNPKNSKKRPYIDKENMNPCSPPNLQTKSKLNLTLPNKSELNSLKLPTNSLSTLPSSTKYRSRSSNFSKVSLNYVHLVRKNSIF